MEADNGGKQKYKSNEHSCKTYGKSFPFKSQLTRHERVHTGVSHMNVMIVIRLLWRVVAYISIIRGFIQGKSMNVMFVKRLMWIVLAYVGIRGFIQVISI